MVSHAIRPEHRDQLAQSEHVLTFLQAEAVRLDVEREAHARMWQREEARLRSLLAQYGIAGEFTLDTKAGTITTPGNPPEVKEADSEPTAE